MASSDNDTTSVPFTIDYSDVVGNVGPTTTSTTDSSSVTFDKTPPGSLSASITTADPSSNLPITVAISASDNGTKVSAYNISNNFSASSAPAAPLPTSTGWITISSPSTSYDNATVAYNLDNIGDGNRKVYVWFRDGAGNVSSEATDNITIDTQPPILTEDTPVGDNVSNSLHSSSFRLTDNATPLVTLNSSENGTLTYSSTCNSASTSTTTAGNFSITLDSNASGGALADGNYASCQVTITDDAGNASSPLTLTAFTVDAVSYTHLRAHET